jgi:hypothetical protein
MRHLVLFVSLFALLAAPAPSVWARQLNGDAAPAPADPAPADPVPADPVPADAAPADTAQAPQETALDPDALPFNIDRIQRRLSRPPAITPESGRVVFRTVVFGRNPTIDEILGPDWRKGPTPLGGMTHQEFLNVVTPKDVQGYAPYDNKQAMVIAATSFAMQWALKQAVKKLDDAKTARQKEAAQKEVDEALADLRKARRAAGLPDK